MASISASRRPLGRLARQLLSPNTNTLLPRLQRAGLAQVHSPETLAESNEKEVNTEEIFQNLPPSSRILEMDPSLRQVLTGARLPKNLQALFNKPLRRKPTHGVPICDLQIRSFNVRSLELFSDFAMRAAYYMNLPARGPVALPRIVEKWTVPKSNFVHKKSQENFNRITVRRLIQIQDGNAETVQAWLGYLYKRSFAGVGMKANIYDWEETGVPQRMDEGAEEAMESFKEQWGNFSIRTNEETAEKVEKFFDQENFETQPREAESFHRKPIEISRPRTKT